jgi:hypothetical protein
MRTITDLAPLAIALAIVGAVTWVLLDRNIGIGRWLLAALLLAHGWVHLMFVFPQPDASTATAGGLAWPFDMGRSWLISTLGLDPALVRIAGLAGIAVAFVLGALAALATVGVLVPASWWAALVVGAAMSSTILLAIFFSPAFLLGFGINLALLWLVFASAWRPGTGLPA